MSEHTPGEWRVVDNPREGDDGEYLTIESEHGIIVGDEGIWLSPSVGSNLANATLMASAPALLRALKEVVYHAHHPLSRAKAIENAKAEIAKATTPAKEQAVSADS